MKQKKMPSHYLLSYRVGLSTSSAHFFTSQSCEDGLYHTIFCGL